MSIPPVTAATAQEPLSWIECIMQPLVARIAALVAPLFDWLKETALALLNQAGLYTPQPVEPPPPAPLPPPDVSFEKKLLRKLRLGDWILPEKLVQHAEHYIDSEERKRIDEELGEDAKLHPDRFRPYLEKALEKRIAEAAK